MQNKLILARRRRIFLGFYSAKQVGFSPPQAEILWGFTVHKNEKTIDFSPPQAENFRGFTKHKTKKQLILARRRRKKIWLISTANFPQKLISPALIFEKLISTLRGGGN